ncbi:hypothetical protein [Mycoplasma tauri]|uniref:hypothetical protein n=1 Tax=Mycoplasma tauri TaxID=547987 RepID=UPI001CBBB110|nr:hypothetical protein [Mycoplasma tauri]MBZ4218339.1 hypothetical protein [Mycoplasma tauri]
MQLSTSEIVQFTFITVFLLFTFLVKVHYFFSFKSKEWHIYNYGVGKWYSSLSIMIIAMIFSGIVIYTWVMALIINLFNKYYNDSLLHPLQAKTPIIFSFIIVQFIHINNLVLFFKFAVFKKYAKPNKMV